MSEYHELGRKPNFKLATFDADEPSRNPSEPGANDEHAEPRHLYLEPRQQHHPHSLTTCQERLRIDGDGLVSSLVQEKQYRRARPKQLEHQRAG